MNYYIIPKNNLIVGWNAKCGCTTVKAVILRRAGFEVEGNVHNDVFNLRNLREGKYGVYDLVKYLKKTAVKYEKHKKIAVLRNPYYRLMSGLRQRAPYLTKHGFGNYKISQMLIHFKNNKFDPDPHHFEPQSSNLLPFSFDKVIDLQSISEFYLFLNVPFQKERAGGHITKYVDKEDSYHELTLSQLIARPNFSKNIRDWFGEDDIININIMFKDDFDFAHENGITYQKL